MIIIIEEYVSSPQGRSGQIGGHFAVLELFTTVLAIFLRNSLIFCQKKVDYVK